MLSSYEVIIPFGDACIIRRWGRICWAIKGLRKALVHQDNGHVSVTRIMKQCIEKGNIRKIHGIRLVAVAFHGLAEVSGVQLHATYYFANELRSTWLRNDKMRVHTSLDHNSPPETTSIKAIGHLYNVLFLRTIHVDLDVI